jgi:predicted phosphodiesterase
MKIFATSDIHVDYDANKKWLNDLSMFDYKDDVLIVAGDVTDSLPLLEWSLKILCRRFKCVLFVPGNHELWLARDPQINHSLEKFQQVRAVTENAGASMQVYHTQLFSIVPLLAWYDYSFGRPGKDLLDNWMDFRACRWPEEYGATEVTDYFLKQNVSIIEETERTIISFSHFLPRIDVMPKFIPVNRRFIYPVLGTSRLDKQIRQLKSKIHIYEHSHVNQTISLDGTTYINNAFGYPQEERISAKNLLCIYEE